MWAGVSPFLPRRRRWAYLDSLESFVMALYLAEMTAKLVRSGAERFFAQVRSVCASAPCWRPRSPPREYSEYPMLPYVLRVPRVSTQSTPCYPM
jgi:hypothetical protein